MIKATSITKRRKRAHKAWFYPLPICFRGRPTEAQMRVGRNWVRAWRTKTVTLLKTKEISESCL